MPIVYDGTEGSSHGDLFKGLKLFISLRVPQRDRWVNLVKGNGGEVVALENQADMLIADHVKRNGAPPPPGSYSWQWIQYSVKNGFLETQDDYRIGEDPTRVARASAPAKGKRVKFTKEDDDILAKFVRDHERQGSKVKGNVIFEELHKKYPNRHTPQSWRDRWVRHVSTHPRSSPPEENPPPGARVGTSPGRDSRPVDQPPQTHARPSNVKSTPARSPDSTPQKDAQGRTKFTEEDDEILRKMIRETREIAAAKGKPARGLDGNKIFQDLAAKASLNNRHSAHSWRNRWVRHLKLIAEQDDLEMQDEEEEVPETPAEPPKPQSRASREPAAPRTQAESITASSSAAVSLRVPSTLQRPQPKSDDERLKRQAQSKKRDRDAMLLQQTWRGDGVVGRDRALLESSIVPLQSLMRGYLLRMRKAESLRGALETNAEPLEDDHDEDAQEDLNSEVDGNDSSLRDQFYEDLRDYIDVTGAEIELRPVIDGREIELWDLFSIATRQDCAAEDRDWKKVAHRLGFDWTTLARCADDLKECYDRNLTEFEEAIGSYDDQDGAGRVEDEQVSGDDESRALLHTSDAVTARKEPSSAPLSPIYRSSSPTTGVKRSFQQSNDPQSSELGYPSDRSSKRQRRDRAGEIPRTPEHELAFAEGSSSRAAVQDCSSPSKSRGAATEPKGMYSVDDAEDFLNNGIHGMSGNQEIDHLPDIAPAGKRRFVEPETQDFGVAMGREDDVRQSIERDDLNYMTDEYDISPSQQLRSEFDAFSSPPPAIPFRGNGVGSANRPLFVEPGTRLQGGPANDTRAFVSGTGAISGSTEHAARNSTSGLKATKRSLPQQYRTQQAIPAAARPHASAPARNGIAAAPLQSRSPILARPPAHRSGIANQQSQQKMSATSTGNVHSSVQLSNPSRRTPASSASVLDTSHTKDRAAIPDFDEQYVDAQFDHFRALGYDIQHIGRAMEITSLQRGPMTVALQSLAAGKGVPQKEPGVWTDDDDEKLRKIRDYDRGQKSGVQFSGSGQSTKEKEQVERYRSFLLEKHQSWIAHRVAFMKTMDKGTAA